MIYLLEEDKLTQGHKHNPVITLLLETRASSRHLMPEAVKKKSFGALKFQHESDV